MLKVRASESYSQDDFATKLVTCPHCGQKLGDIRYLKGVLILRVKCRRCKKYIDVEAVGKD